MVRAEAQVFDTSEIIPAPRHPPPRRRLVERYSLVTSRLRAAAYADDGPSLAIGSHTRYIDTNGGGLSNFVYMLSPRV